ncbi:MAG: ribosome recycling factor [Leptospirales bacterium]|nr:ribosome recycling factor [Leptospirales bacterium]
MPDKVEPAQVIAEIKTRMQKTIDSLTKDLAAIRSTRATPSMLDAVHVEYYGTMTPLNQLASIQAPEARMLTITPYDKSALGDIEKAILKSDVGITPSNDGGVIRLNLPELSMERRQELVKQVKVRLEECKVSIRNVRRDGNEELKKMGKSQDELKGLQDDVQKVTDGFVHKADELAQAKEKSILTV